MVAAPSSPGIVSDSFVTLHYAIRLDDDSEAVSTFDLSPATLQMGSGQLCDNLEKCLFGLQVGEQREFALRPDAAFGEHNPLLVEKISRSAMPPDVTLKENALIEFSRADGSAISGLCRQLADEHVVIDFNHPLAGRPIVFSVKIIGIM